MRNICQKYAEYWLAASIFPNRPWKLATWRNSTRRPMHIPKQTSSSQIGKAMAKARVSRVEAVCGISRAQTYHAAAASQANRQPGDALSGRVALEPSSPEGQSAKDEEAQVARHIGKGHADESKQVHPAVDGRPDPDGRA